jgi:hypothetical protein
MRYLNNISKLHMSFGWYESYTSSPTVYLRLAMICTPATSVCFALELALASSLIPWCVHVHVPSLHVPSLQQVLRYTARSNPWPCLAKKRNQPNTCVRTIGYSLRSRRRARGAAYSPMLLLLLLLPLPLPLLLLLLLPVVQEVEQGDQFAVGMAYR